MSQKFTLIKSEPVVKAIDIYRSYQMGEHTLNVLKGVSILVERGGFTAIAGPSGSGKTTLLNILGCIDRPNSGDVFVEGVPTRYLGPDALADFRAQKIGFIFQTFNLIPTLTALENVEYPLMLLEYSSKDKRDLAREALRRVGLEKFEKHRPNQMSGGQRQRVAIARAIVKKPSLILADEPTANLDKRMANEVLDLMQELHSNDKATFVFSSHDPLVLSRTPHVVHLIEGRHEEEVEVSRVA